MKEVYMPALGMAQETGTLLEWYKQVGDSIVVGEPLILVATDKSEVEIMAPASGVLADVRAVPGSEVPVGEVIAVILAPGERVAAGTIPPALGVPAPQVRPVAARVAAEHDVDLSELKRGQSHIEKEDVLAYVRAREAAPGGHDRGRILASPKARRLALEYHIDLAQVNGRGPEGAILGADVLAAAGSQSVPAGITQPPEPALATLPVSRMWQAMVRRLTESWTSIPHFYLSADYDAGELLLWHERVQRRVAVNVTLTDLLVRLVAAALRHHPRLNASWIENRIVRNDEINIGLAVAVEEGLLVPVIAAADRRGIGELATIRAGLVERAQAGTLTPDDLREGTFTISNLGMYGVDHFNAIINPPQVAILAVGRVAERCMPVNDQVVVRKMVTLTLTCDHRVVDGVRGAQFLQTLADLIRDPLAMVD